MRGPDAARPEEEVPVVIRDKRRIDPESGTVRPDPAGSGAPTVDGGPPGSGPDAVPQHTAMDPRLSDLEVALGERTADLQRLKAEYDNYRRRVDRDRQVVAEQAAARVVASLLPALDDIGRARVHGELEGAFRAVAESVEKELTALGLERYGTEGDPFDPTVHEALMHSYSASVSAPTCVSVLRPGYTFAGRVLRPAQVAVAEPEDVPEPDGRAPDPTEPGLTEPAGAPSASSAETAEQPDPVE